jgi:hypothetical protein
MKVHFKDMPWCRYADVGLVHCRSEQQAKHLLAVLRSRFEECGLELHPDKTQIIYCKDGKRKQNHHCTRFDFLGYTFKPKLVRNSKDMSFFVSFTPEVSKSSMKSMRDKTRSCKWHLRSDLSLEDISRKYNPVLRGWMNYYGRYCPTGLEPVWRHFNRILVKWSMRKYKKLKGRKKRSGQFMTQIAGRSPNLFAHWNRKNTGSFV